MPMILQPIDYVVDAWLVLALLSAAYVAFDQFRGNPEVTVMKWGFVLVTLYMGPIGLLLYVMAEETLLARGRIFLDWLKIGGSFENAMPRHWHQVPTALISFGYPYYLYDAPRMPTVINAFATMPSMQAAVVEALMGRAKFGRKSPVDAFCGLGDARY